MRSSWMLIVILAAAGCGASQRGEPSGPPVRPDDATEARGQRLFAQFCYQCHPGGEGGLGPSLNDKPLPELAVRTQIREGVGAMPGFGEQLLSDDDVAAIAEYVEELRQSPAEYAGR